MFFVNGKLRIVCKNANKCVNCLWQLINVIVPLQHFFTTVPVSPFIIIILIIIDVVASSRAVWYCEWFGHCVRMFCCTCLYLFRYIYYICYTVLYGQWFSLLVCCTNIHGVTKPSVLFRSVSIRDDVNVISSCACLMPFCSCRCNTLQYLSCRYSCSWFLRQFLHVEYNRRWAGRHGQWHCSGSWDKARRPIVRGRRSIRPGGRVVHQRWRPEKTACTELCL